ALHVLLDRHGAGEQPQPEPDAGAVAERAVMLFPDRQHLGHAISTASPLRSERMRSSVRAATSAGAIRRPDGLSFASSSMASASLRPVLARMLATEPTVMSVSTKPGQTAFTRSFVFPYSAASARVSPTAPCLATM